MSGLWPWQRFQIRKQAQNHPWKRLSKVLDAYEVFLQVERICGRVLSDLTCIVSTCTTPSLFTVPPITMSPFFLRHRPSILCEHVPEPTISRFTSWKHVNQNSPPIKWLIQLWYSTSQMHQQQRHKRKGKGAKTEKKRGKDKRGIK